jgi:hypothetical protein
VARRTRWAGLRAGISEGAGGWEPAASGSRPPVVGVDGLVEVVAWVEVHPPVLVISPRGASGGTGWSGLAWGPASSAPSSSKKSA